MVGTKSDHKIEPGLLAVVVGRRFHILELLFPSHVYCLSDLAKEAGMDEGNLSRYIDELESLRLVSTEREKSKRGRPRLKITLTEKGRKIVGALLDTSGVSTTSTVLDTEYLEEYLTLLKSDVFMIKRYAAEEIEYQSRRNNINDIKFILKIRTIIQEENDPEIIKIILDAIKNIIINSDQKTMESIRSLLKDPILDLMNITQEKTDTETRIKRISLQILYEIFTIDEKFIEINKLYFQFIRKKSKLISEARKYLLSNHIDKIKELRIELIKMFSQSDPDINEIIEEELSQLR